MKNIWLTAVLMTGIGAANLWAVESQVQVTVNGMVCSFCAQGITKKFQAQPEVSKVDVNLGDQKVVLSLKDGQTLEDEKIRKLLKESGYSVEKVERVKS
jgi:periplasmic mercuric ion binding protein